MRVLTDRRNGTRPVTVGQSINSTAIVDSSFSQFSI